MADLSTMRLHDRVKIIANGSQFAVEHAMVGLNGSSDLCGFPLIAVKFLTGLRYILHVRTPMTLSDEPPQTWACRPTHLISTDHGVPVRESQVALDSPPRYGLVMFE